MGLRERLPARDAVEATPDQGKARRQDETTHSRAAIAAVVFEQLEGLYRRTRNPLHAWSALKLARTVRMPPPAWVLDYLYDVAEKLTISGHVHSPKRIAEALGLATRGGPSKIRQMQTVIRDADVEALVEGFRNLAKADPKGNPDPWDTMGVLTRVAEVLGRSLDRVQAIYYRTR
jgi:hypothetical protein